MEAGEIAPDFFLNVKEITEPKPMKGVTALWDDMVTPQADNWINNGLAAPGLKESFSRFLELAREAAKSSEGMAQLAEVIEKTDDLILYGVVRALHIRVHMEQIDDAVAETARPRAQIAKPGETNLLHAKLILQSFLDYLRAHGPDSFAEWVNTNALRLVSTVHPNETERNTNLMHYNTVYDKWTEWKRQADALQQLSHNAPEYRLRREQLNHLRRAIKSDLEALWQSDQMRNDPIPVQSEATRVLERYKTVYRGYPLFAKFVKKLVKEAFYLYSASKYANDPKWVQVFRHNMRESHTREDKLRAIKRTFSALNIRLTIPRLRIPPITFGTWKGGDRDGNPFVVASFSNATLLDQKEFALKQYIAITRDLIDKLTTSTHHIPVTPELAVSVQADSHTFPYLTNIKPHEPYRAKIRYVLEKLENTLQRVTEVKKQAGETVKPLLSLTLPGPTGYSNVSELMADMQLIYDSLLLHTGKAQARSTVQDLCLLIQTFGFHMTSIDFRQTSEKNTDAVQEYLKAVDYPELPNILKMSERDRQALFLDLILYNPVDFNPWIVPQLSKTTRDTFETLLIFSDAARADPNMIGKFIISMCQYTSDILTVLFLMKLTGMLSSANGRITRCPFDVTGLFETIKDLQSASVIVKELLSIPAIREYIVRHRGGKIAVMLGYSDSTRDGSSLASDAQIIGASLALLEVEKQLNEGFPKQEHVYISFYRGRGDTLPRGFGGSPTKAMTAQMVASATEDHTEQNRYLRRYASVASAVDHLHVLYSAHLSVRLATPPLNTPRYQTFFNFFSRISTWKWHKLVRPEKGCHGDVYFGLLTKHSILPHLPRSHFASRPVARDGITYNIDKIRAIPFTMVLAQLREFTSAYYGTGTAFEVGVAALEHSLEIARSNKGGDVAKALAASSEKLADLLVCYSSPADAYSDLTTLSGFLLSAGQTPTQLLQEMYHLYPPFRNSIENKETSLVIRNKRIVDDYVRNPTPEEKAVLDDTELEAQLAKKWVLQINQQDKLESKNLTQDFNSPELYLIHMIQSRFLRIYRELTSIKDSAGKARNKDRLARLEKALQMSILAVSEALGFAG